MPELNDIPTLDSDELKKRAVQIKAPLTAADVPTLTEPSSQLTAQPVTSEVPPPQITLAPPIPHPDTAMAKLAQESVELTAHPPQEPPSWNEIKSAPEYTSLPVEKKVELFSKWHDDALQYGQRLPGWDQVKDQWHKKANEELENIQPSGYVLDAIAKGALRGAYEGVAGIAKGASRLTGLRFGTVPGGGLTQPMIPGDTFQDVLKTTERDPLFQWAQQAPAQAEKLFPLSAAEKAHPLVKAARAVGGFAPVLAGGPFAPFVMGMQAAGSQFDDTISANRKAGMPEEQAIRDAYNKATAAGLTDEVVWGVMPAPLRAGFDKLLIDQFGPAVIRRFIAGRAAAVGEMGSLGALTRMARNTATGEELFKGVPGEAASLALTGLALPHGKSAAEVKAREDFRNQVEGIHSDILREHTLPEASAEDQLKALNNEITWRNLEVPVTDETGKIVTGMRPNPDVNLTEEDKAILARRDELVRAQPVTPEGEAVAAKAETAGAPQTAQAVRENVTEAPPAAPVEEPAPAPPPAAKAAAALKQEAPPRVSDEAVKATQKLRDKAIESGMLPTIQEVQTAVGDNETASAVHATLKKEMAAAYPPEPIPEGAKQGQPEASGIRKIKLPIIEEPTGRVDAKGNAITRVRPQATNDVYITAAQLNKGEEVFFPKDFDTNKINPNFILKRVADGRLQVIGVDHPDFGEIREPGDLTTAYKESAKRQKRSEEQTGGKERILTQLKGEPPEGGPMTEAEGTAVQDFLDSKGFSSENTTTGKAAGRIFAENEKRFGREGAEQIRDAQQAALFKFIRENPDKKPNVRTLERIAENYAKIAPQTEALPPEEKGVGTREERVVAPEDEEKVFQQILEKEPELHDTEGNDTVQQGDMSAKMRRPTRERLAEANANADKNKAELAKMGALEKKTPDRLGTILQYIADDPNQSELNRIMAKHILRSGRDTSKVKVISKFRPYDEKATADQNYRALYRADLTDPEGGGTLFINTAADHEHTVAQSVLHEAGHDSMLVKLLEDKEGNPTYDHNAVEYAAYKGIKSAYALSVKKLSNVIGEDGLPLYGLRNVHEFGSEIMANEEFRNAVASIKPGFLESIKNWFVQLFYGKEIKPTSVLDKAIRNVLDLTNEPVRNERAIRTRESVLPREAYKPEASNKDQMIVRELKKGKTVEQVAKENSLTSQQVEQIYDRTIQAKVAEEAKPSPKINRRFGVSQKMFDEQGIPTLLGESTLPSELVEQGREDLAAGVDPHERLTVIESIKAAPSSRDFSLFRAYGEQLAKTRAELEDKVAENPTQANAEARDKAENDLFNWANKLKRHETEWGESGRAMQGATDIDTGTFYGLQYDLMRRLGRNLKPEEVEEAKRIVKQSKKIMARVQAANDAANEAFEMQLGKTEEQTAAEINAAKESEIAIGESDTVGKTPIVKHTVGGIKPTAKKVGKAKGLLAEGTFESLQKYFTDKFEKKPARIAGNNFTPTEAAAIWKLLKTNIHDFFPTRNGDVFATIKPSDLYDKASAQLGMSPNLLREALASAKSIRNANNTLYAAQAQQRALLVAARSWAEARARGLKGEVADFAWNLQRSISVLGHVNAPLTHGVGLIAYPPTWGIQKDNMLKTFQTFLHSSVHEGMLQSMMNSENYGRFTKAGLAAKVGVLDDIAQYQSFFERTPGIGRLARAGNRGMDVLKIMRMDIANKWYNSRLTDAERKEVESNSDAGKQILTELMGLVNTSTGTTTKGTALGKMLTGKWARNVFFAPRLEGARWQDTLINPVRAGLLYLDPHATAGEKVFRRLVLRQNIVKAATYAGMLGANQALLSALGSDDKINFTDPSRNDWLQFKVAGQTIVAPSSFLGPLRLTTTIALSHFIPMENRKNLLDMIKNYAFGKTNPVINDFVEAYQGTQTGTGRPITIFPWAPEQKVKASEMPKDPVDILEYALDKAPIPFSQTAQEHLDLMKEYGIGDEIAKVWLGDAIAFIASLMATHTHATAPEKEAK